MARLGAVAASDFIDDLERRKPKDEHAQNLGDERFPFGRHVFNATFEELGSGLRSVAVVGRANRPFDLSNQAFDGVEDGADDGVVVPHLGIGSDASGALELGQPFVVNDAAGMLEAGRADFD